MGNRKQSCVIYVSCSTVQNYQTFFFNAKYTIQIFNTNLKFKHCTNDFHKTDVTCMQLTLFHDKLNYLPFKICKKIK